MKKPLVLFVLLALAAAGAAPASAGRRGSSFAKNADLGLDEPLHIPAHGAHISEATASLSSVTGDRLSDRLRAGRISPARFALERAEETLEGDFDGHVSLVLTDLALRVRHLSGVARDRALAILARPTDRDGDNSIDDVSYRDDAVQAECSASFCVHWTETGRHAVALADEDADTIPDYVETVLLEMENVRGVLVDDLGFRAPKSDATSRNTVPPEDAAKLDVYLVDGGRDGVYGFCTTDDPNLLDRSRNYEYFDGSSYCALDNDFKPTQFGGAPADESLRVTAAHEYFHAIQLAYSAGHDTWMSEGTAALMEDVVHDEVDDNYQYLVSSPLRQPAAPLDFGKPSYHYGAWLFWRFLTELSPAADAEPFGTAIIKDVWTNAAFDGPSATNLVSTFAMRKALADRGVAFPAAKSLFSLVNYVPEAFYEEGADYLTSVGGKRPPLMGTFTLSGTKKSTGPRVAALDHLTAGYVAFKPGAGVGKLRVNVDLPAANTSPRAAILILTTDGQAFNQSIDVGSTGVGGIRGIPFKKGEIRMVILVLDNASTRFKSCYRRNTPWTCSGVPVDDGLRFQVSGTAS